MRCSAPYLGFEDSAECFAVCEQNTAFENIGVFYGDRCILGQRVKQQCGAHIVLVARGHTRRERNAVTLLFQLSTNVLFISSRVEKGRFENLIMFSCPMCRSDVK